MERRTGMPQGRVSNPPLHEVNHQDRNAMVSFRRANTPVDFYDYSTYRGWLNLVIPGFA